MNSQTTRQGIRNLNPNGINGKHRGPRVSGAYDYHDCFALARSTEIRAADGSVSIIKECGVCRKVIMPKAAL